MSDPDAAFAGGAPRTVEHTPAPGTVTPEAPAAPPAAPARVPPGEKPRSLGQDAWDQLRRNPVAIVSAVIIVVLVVMAVAPGVFTSKDPNFCQGSLSRQSPSSSAWFGYDVQGCDVYARTIYGARASMLVGLLASVSAVLVGSLLGMLAGYFGGITDSVISRITDIFFGIPLLLGGIIVLTTFPSGEGTNEWWSILKVGIALAALGWPSINRIMRSVVLQVKQMDYVAAARALGATAPRILRVHVLPNAIQPVIVYGTIALGAFIGAEATLSYLGIGLQPPAISWGIAISSAQDYMRTSPHMLLFPGLFLSLTVLAFIMLGDAVRDALDPKLR
jgi:oligopeptide transport system permease protein